MMGSENKVSVLTVLNPENMDLLQQLIHPDIPAIVKAGGYVGLTLIVFAESGLFFGFFLPGDSLLFTAGIIAAEGTLSIGMLIPLCAAAAILGDNVGYWFGKKVGPAIFTKEEGFFFRKDHIDRTQRFFDKYGPKAIILARFVPIVRTFTPILAGVGRMHYGTFLFYNILGGSIWTIGLTSAGYFLGRLIPNIDRYLLPIIIGIIVISFIPVIVEIIKGRKNSQVKRLDRSQ